MIILPAIDLLGGNCVRLKKGEYGSAEKVAEDPFTTLDRFAEAGATAVHIVDLDGAKHGDTVNGALILKMVQYADRYGMICEVGGGIRSMDTVKAYLDGGVERAILGSVALRQPELVEQACKLYDRRIAVGIDAFEGQVKTDGWLQGSGTYFTDVAKQMEEMGVGNIIFTDISRDGMLSGPNFAQLSELQAAVKVDITASGGIKSIDDILALRDMGLYGAICGKSIYQGTLSLPQAVLACK